MGIQTGGLMEGFSWEHSAEVAERRFREMGADVAIKYGTARRFTTRDPELPYLEVDIRKNKNKEVFDIRTDRNIQILDLDKAGRHLLMMVKNDKQKSKFLCGHDERQWFVCAIPEHAKVSTVIQAKQALKPSEFVAAEKGVRAKNLHKRHKVLSSGKGHRQGEFFFIPSTLKPDEESFKTVIHHNEPISRGRGRDHMVEKLYRVGGETVLTRDGLIYTEQQARAYSLAHRNERPRFQRRTKDATVYASGKVTHPEHATLDLGSSWYLVVMNTEGDSKATTSVTFLD